MSDKIYLGKNVASVQESPPHLPYSKVVIIAGENDDGTQTVYEAGNDTGRTLEVKNPLMAVNSPSEGSQVASDILARVQGYAYKPFSADGALLDPAAELGDAVTIDGVYSVIASLNTQFDALYTAEISAPDVGELDHEYPFVSNEVREQHRQAATITASLKIGLDSITARVEGQYADEWESGALYPKGRVVKITDTNNASISYYSCKLAHTSDATNKPPTGTDHAQYWDAVIAPTVESIVNIGLNAISVGISSDSSGSKISLTTNGITVESSTINLHVKSANIDGTITADTVKSTWVYAGDVSASQITAGTINGASETINLKGDINLQMPNGTAVGKIGGFNVSSMNYASLSSANGGASVGVAYLDLQDGLPDIVGISADRIQCRGRLQLDNGSYGDIAQMGRITSQNPQTGQVFFLIP